MYLDHTLPDEDAQQHYVANLALGNQDNHASKSALQRDFNGRLDTLV